MSVDRQPLSPGRQKLAPDVVLAHQRGRLLDAAARALLDVGYLSLNVGDICAQARVSRATFYVHFENKLDCLRAAHSDAAEVLFREIELACAQCSARPQKVAAALSSGVRLLSTSPARGNLLTIDAGGIEDTLAIQINAVRDRLALMLRGALARDEGLPELTERALIGGACTVLASALHDGQSAAQIDRLAAQLAELLLIPYLGAVEARAQASSARSRKN